MSTTFSKDQLNQQIETLTPSLVYCSKLNITRAEFSASGQSGHKPQLMLVVDSDEYDGEVKVEYDRTTYSIYKEYVRSDGYTELYCEVRSGG